jgi:hypothetical protein
MTNIMTVFKVMIIVQLFYAFSITVLVYATPTNAADYITSYQGVTTTIDLETVREDVESSLERQTDIQLLEVGALVFYSGNILIDLILNFLFAIPQMVGMLLNGISQIIGIDEVMWQTVEIFSMVAIGVWYMVSVIQLLVGVRSGRVV